MEIRPALKEEWNKFVENNSKDSYSKGTLDFSVSWADKMEQKLSEGYSLANIAKDCSNEADTEGITGFMYGCAVSALSNYWIHGEELRQWHNKDTQLGTEGDEANESGGVLNPAVISF